MASAQITSPLSYIMDEGSVNTSMFICSYSLPIPVLDQLYIHMIIPGVMLYYIYIHAN